MLHKHALIAMISLGLPAQTINAYSVHTTKYARTWATHTSINLYDCAPNLIRSQSEIERFIRTLCSHLGLTRHGKTQFLYHYAGYGYTSGLSAMQPANGHTDIALRVDELNNDVYIDFFSCTAYNSYEIARLAQDYFMAVEMNYESVQR